MNGSFDNISETIQKYSKIKFSDEQVKLPKLVSLARLVTNALSYWFCYIIINNYIAQKKIDFLSILIVILGIISSVILGSRGGAINIILAMIAIYTVIKNKKNGYGKDITKKFILKILIILGVILLTFQMTGSLLGRKSNSKTAISNMNFFDYLSIYCGAQIKNLDTYLQEDNIDNENLYWGSQTFVYVIRYFGGKLNWSNSYYALTLPMRKVDGFNLGNVYTTFYPYIYDFGYIGEIILVAIMAIIAQLVYETCRSVTLKSKPKVSILVYSYIFSTIVFSFFSNKFYENIFNKQFLNMILLWYIFNLVFYNIAFENIKNLFINIKSERKMRIKK